MQAYIKHDSCQCMTKSLQYCKVNSLQPIKINEEKNKVLERAYSERVTEIKMF